MGINNDSYEKFHVNKMEGKLILGGIGIAIVLLIKLGEYIISLFQ